MKPPKKPAGDRAAADDVDIMERYVKHAKTWAEAAKAGAADVE